MGKYDLGRALVEATITRALKDMENDSHRTARNLVDLGLTLAKGTFERLFLTACRRVLDNENSTYYTALDRALRDFDRDTLVTYGINTGFEGCSRGAKRIREIEAKRGFNIPWTIRLSVGRQGLNLTTTVALVREAVTLGIHAFRLIDCNLDQRELTELLEKYPTCAFTLFTTGDRETPWQLEELKKQHNLLCSVSLQRTGARELCCQLARARMPYALHLDYDDGNVESMPGLLELAGELGGLLVFFRGFGASEGTRASVYGQILESRTAGAYPFVPIDIPADLLAIDEVISSDCCSLEILPDGRAATHLGLTDSSVMTMSLTEIMEKELPKTTD